MRHNFSRGVRDKLRQRVGNLCSRPDCRCITSAAATHDDKVATIGVAAHISAASPGGPRWKPELTKKQRSSYENGIWLCANHASQIDRDEAGHSEETLRAWKADAELFAKDHLGKKLPHPDDAADTLKMALGTKPSRPVFNAVTNVHKTLEQSLQDLDPRLRFVSGRSDGSNTLRIEAKESFPFVIRLHCPDGDAPVASLAAALDSGRAYELPIQGATIEGSPALEELFRQLPPDKVVLAPAKRDIEVRLTLVPTTAGSSKWSFDLLRGGMSFGAQSAHLTASACAEMIGLEMQVPRELNRENTFDLRVRIQRWIGSDVNSLPYWEPIRRLVQRNERGDALRLEIQWEGLTLLAGQTGGLPKTETWSNLVAAVAYIAGARAICRLAGTRAVCDFDQLGTEDEQRAVQRLGAQIEGRKQTIVDMEEFELSVQVTEEIKNAFRSASPLPIEQGIIPAGQAVNVTVFGQEIVLPRRTAVIENALWTPPSDLEQCEIGTLVPFTVRLEDEDACVRYVFGDEAAEAAQAV